MASPIDGKKALYQVKRKINIELDVMLRKHNRPKSTVRSILFRDFGSSVVKEDNSSLVYRCNRLDPKARQVMLDIIFQMLLKYDLKVRTVDAILSQYYINYYGSPSDLTSSKNIIGLSKIRKILISKNDDYDKKLRKLAQVVYQDFYGASVMDEFIYMPIDEDGTKIEEVAGFGPDSLWFSVSSITIKLDKVQITPDMLRNCVDRLSTNSPDMLLNKTTSSISTDSLHGDRITLTCPDYTRYYEFNIRRHYPSFIDTQMLIDSGSSTAGFERWLDDVMQCFPRVVLSGDQSSGKTTRLRLIAERYPAGTVIGTIESSYELELAKIPHLIVKQLKANTVNPEKALEDSLRFGLDIIINGETRSGIEVATALQAGQRSSKGTITTSHAPDAESCLRSYRQLLVRDKLFSNETSALYFISQCLDIVIVPAADKLGEGATGFRYIDSVYEIPKVKESECVGLEPRLLFRANEETKLLEFVDNISDSTLEFFSRRCKNTEVLERLRYGNYN